MGQLMGEPPGQPRPGLLRPFWLYRPAAALDQGGAARHLDRDEQAARHDAAFTPSEAQRQGAGHRQAILEQKAHGAGVQLRHERPVPAHRYVMCLRVRVVTVLI